MLVLHPESERQYAQLSTNLPHALLIIGEKGRGASTVARQLAHAHTKTIQEIVPEKDSKPHPEGSIGVERIRELYQSSRSRVDAARIIIVHDAHAMTPQAQNAFLKLLEEPSAHTHFILTAHDRTTLLPTVVSRVQLLELRPITADQSTKLLDSLGVDDAKKRAQLLFVATSNPAELSRLSSDDAQLAKISQFITDARGLLQLSPYEKLRITHTYKDDRAEAIQLLDTTMELLKRSLLQSGGSLNHLDLLDTLLASRERLRKNGNVRLVLAGVVV